MIKYRVWAYENKIIPVEILSETKNFVITKNRPKFKEAKSSQHECYFDSWEEAHDHILARSISKVDLTRAQLRRYESELDEVKLMRKPSNAD